MYQNILTDILFLAENHHFKFVPAAGCDWKGDFDLGKQPLVSIHEASAERAKLTAWAEKYKGCNWLYVPGDGQYRLDVDPRHGGDVLLRELEATHGPLPRTPKARTGGGGWHQDFAGPPGLSFKHDIMGNSGLTLATGGKMGFIVPPCRHASGGVYAWEAAPWDVPLAHAPQWLLDTAQAVKPGVPAQTPPQPGALQFVMGGGERLATHPGEDHARRNRHATLLELVGRELGYYKRSPEEIKPELLAWADRCDPPLEHLRALRQLRTLHEAEERKREAQQQHTHTTAVPATAAPAKERSREETLDDASADGPDTHTSFLPSAGGSPRATEGSARDTSLLLSFGDADDEPKEPPAFLTHGLVGDIARAVGPQIEGRIEPVVFCVLSSFGSAVGPTPHVRTGAARHRGNLFGVVVAPSGVGKSEPWDVCDVLLQYAAPEWHGSAVGHGLGSGEGLIAWLEQQPVAFSVESEFGALITKARREGSTLGPVLCCAWDGKPLENRISKATRAEGHVSLWANITDAELAARLGKGLETVNGFGNRFLWLRQERVRYLPRGGDLRCLMDLSKSVREAVEKAKVIEKVVWSADAGVMWDAAYRGLCDVQGEHWSLGRARSQALRLVLLYTLLDGAAVIAPEHVEAGVSAWAWAEASARSIFTPVAVNPGAQLPTFVMGGVQQQQQNTHDQEGSLESRALARIVAQPGVRRSELTKAMNVPSGALGEALALLDAGGKAHPRISTGKGRPAERWWPGPAPEGRKERSNPPTGESLPEPELPSLVPVAPDGTKEGTKEVNPGAAPAPDQILPSSAGAAAGAGDDPVGVCGVVLPTPERKPSPEWLAAYEKAQAEYQEELRRRRGDDEVMTEEEFFATLKEM